MKVFVYFFMVFLFFMPFYSHAEDKAEFITPDIVDVWPAVMMKNGEPMGCGYNFNLVFLEGANKVRVLGGSYNFSTLGTSAFSTAGTFKLVLSSAEMNNAGIDPKKLKKIKIFSAWTKPNDRKFENTSKYLENVHDKDPDEPAYFGTTPSIELGGKITEIWESLAIDGGQIGFNTTGSGYDTVINLPPNFIVKNVKDYQSVYNTVAECMQEYTQNLLPKMQAESDEIDRKEENNHLKKTNQ